MNDLHDNELGFFVDSLNPHQRVYLQRLLGEYLTVLPPEQGDVHPEQLTLLRQGADTLVSLLQHLRQFENQDDDSDIRPFTLAFPEPGHAVITLSVRIQHWTGLWDPKSHAWVSEIKAGRVSVDLAQLEELSSSSIAWLVTLANHLPSRHLYLLHASDRIRRSIRVLRLDEVLLCQ